MSYRETFYREPFNWLNKGHFYKYDGHYFFVTPKYDIKILYDTADYAPHPFKSVLYNEKTYEWTKEFLDKICDEDYNGIENLGEALIITSDGIVSSKEGFDTVGTKKVIRYDSNEDTFNQRLEYKIYDKKYKDIVEWLNDNKGE